MDPVELLNRFTFHPATPETAAKYEEIRPAGHTLAALINSLAPDSREKSLAITHIEEAIFWANAAIARN